MHNCGQAKLDRLPLCAWAGQAGQPLPPFCREPVVLTFQARDPISILTSPPEVRSPSSSAPEVQSPSSSRPRDPISILTPPPRSDLPPHLAPTPVPCGLARAPSVGFAHRWPHGAATPTSLPPLALGALGRSRCCSRPTRARYTAPARTSALPTRAVRGAATRLGAPSGAAASARRPRSARSRFATRGVICRRKPPPGRHSCHHRKGHRPRCRRPWSLRRPFRRCRRQSLPLLRRRHHCCHHHHRRHQSRARWRLSTG